MNELFQTTCNTPVGPLCLIATDAGLVNVYFPERQRRKPIACRYADKHAVLLHACRELKEYFRGELRTFATALVTQGTAFERAVWDALPSVPFGETRSYAQLARLLSVPGTSRSIGNTTKKNPLCIFVPCHRIIAASGSLAGYAGGTENKRWLLMHEAMHARATDR